MDFHTAWLETISTRDKYYLMTFLAVATATFWYRWQLRCLKNLFKLGLVLAVGAALVWGITLLWA